jgi:hypothetical protein
MRIKKFAISMAINSMLLGTINAGELSLKSITENAPEISQQLVKSLIAEKDQVAYDINCRCADTPNDPYDLGAKMTYGPYKDQCQNPCDRRSIYRLPKKFADLYTNAQENVYTVANFSHAGKFYIAKIPKEGVKKVYFQKVIFYIFKGGMGRSIEERSKYLGAAHLQARFEFDKEDPIILIPQDGQGEEKVLYDVISSGEYSAPVGVPYDVVKGLRGGRNWNRRHFSNSHRFKSTPDTIKTEVLDRKNVVEQYELDLEQEERDKMLLFAIENSEAEQMHIPYHLFRNSCSTSAYGALDRILAESRKWYYRGWTKFLGKVPHLAQDGLARRGIIKYNNNLMYKLVKEEYCEDNPTFQNEDFVCSDVLDNYEKRKKAAAPRGGKL